MKTSSIMNDKFDFLQDSGPKPSLPSVLLFLPWSVTGISGGNNGKVWPEGQDEEAEVDVDNEAAQAEYGQLQGETLTQTMIWIRNNCLRILALVTVLTISRDARMRNDTLVQQFQTDRSLLLS